MLLAVLIVQQPSWCIGCGNEWILSIVVLFQGIYAVFPANCNMSRIARFLCYFCGLIFASVLFFTLFPSLKFSLFKYFDERTKQQEWIRQVLLGIRSSTWKRMKAEVKQKPSQLIALFSSLVIATDQPIAAMNLCLTNSSNEISIIREVVHLF